MKGSKTYSEQTAEDNEMYASFSFKNKQKLENTDQAAVGRCGIH